jgi:hypothetical protein
LSLYQFFVEEWLNADTAGFRPEVSTQSISTREPTPTAPLSCLLQVSFAYEFLLARMQTFMAFPVMLTRKCFPAYCAHEWSFIRVRSKMRTKVVSAGESFGAEIALKCGRMLLCPFGISVLRAALRRLVLWIS